MFNTPTPHQVSSWFWKNKSCDAACIAPETLIDRLIDWFFMFYLVFFQSSLHSSSSRTGVDQLAPKLFKAGGRWGRGAVSPIGAFLLDDSSSHRSKLVCVWRRSHRRPFDIWLEKTLLFYSFTASALILPWLRRTFWKQPIRLFSVDQHSPPFWFLFLMWDKAVKRSYQEGLKVAVPTLHSRTSSDGHSSPRRNNQGARGGKPWTFHSFCRVYAVFVARHTQNSVKVAP